MEKYLNKRTGEVRTREEWLLTMGVSRHFAEALFSLEENTVYVKI